MTTLLNGFSDGTLDANSSLIVREYVAAINRWQFIGPITPAQRDTIQNPIVGTKITNSATSGDEIWDGVAWQPVITGPPNTAPTAISFSNTTIDPLSTGGAVIAALTATDPDVGNTFTFTITSDPDSKFDISGSNLIVQAGATFVGGDSHSVTVQVTDNAGGTFTTTQVMTVNPAVVLSFAPAALGNLTLTGAISQVVAASNGTAPYTYAVTAGALPAGVTLNAATGLLSGTPTGAAAPYTFTITATDDVGNTGSVTYSGNLVAPTVTLDASVGNGAVAVPYVDDINATGGTGHTFAVTSGALPAGLSLNAATGGISGTPTTMETATFTVTATSVEGYVGSQTYTVTIAAGAPTITITPTTSPPGVTATQAFSMTVAASGGTAPYTYSLAAGALPTGCTLNASTGVISGTTSASGTFAFTIRATDAAGFSATQAYSVAIAAAPTFTFSPSTLPAKNVGVALSATSVTATGGTAPLTYAVASGTLPTGVTLNTSTGALTGTPTATGTFAFSIRVTDANGFTATKSYSWVIQAGVGSILTTTGWSAYGTNPAAAYGFIRAYNGVDINFTTTPAPANGASHATSGINTALKTGSWKLISISPLSAGSNRTVTVQRTS